MATGAQAKALEAKALKAESKSEGMRMLLEAGRSVAEVRDIFGVQYGFVYGVALRGGYVTPEPREVKAKAPAKKAATATATKSTAKAAPRGRPAAKAASKRTAKVAK